MNLIAFAIFPMLIMADGIFLEKMDKTLTYPTGQHKIIKREAPKAPLQNPVKQKEFYDFVEEKLIQHSQALEHLVKLVTEAVTALNNLAENVGQNVEEPKLPERIMADNVNEERSGDVDESRRFYWGKPLKLSNSYNFKSTSSVWCSVAVLCHRTGTPVCGYDDSFGYGKFDDVCHLIKVNCYWNYNFALVPNCRPTL